MKTELFVFIDGLKVEKLLGRFFVWNMEEFAYCIESIHAYAPEVKVTGAISNISFEMPARKYVNMNCMAYAIAAGLDCKVIIGGAPVSAEACKNIGADEWAHSPQKTVATCKAWAE